MNAYVNHGQWLVDCPRCRSGVPAFPPARVALCIPCRALLPVVVPREWPAVDAVLRLRPKTNRNWLPGEPVLHLIQENLEHGVPI